MCGNNIQSLLQIIRRRFSQHVPDQMQTSCINKTIKRSISLVPQKLADAKELWRKANVVENICFLRLLKSANRMAKYVCQQGVPDSENHS